jgi:hypothetical protein
MLILPFNNIQDCINYIKKFHAEATFLVVGTNDYDYAYVTYNKNKLKGFQLKNVSKYNIQAWANIAITENGIVDMNVRLYEEVNRGVQIDNISEFRKIAESVIKSCKEKELGNGGSLDISEVRYSSEMSVLPFLFFLPYIEDSDNKAPVETVYYDFKRYTSDGKEIPVSLVGIVQNVMNMDVK